MATVRVGRNDLCPCGSGRKFKRCCSAARDAVRLSTATFGMPRPVPGDGADETQFNPRPQMERSKRSDLPIKRIPIHYTYAEPFGDAECVYCFPVDQLFLLEDGRAIPAERLQAGIRFRLDDGSHGTVTAVEPPKVWGPPSRTPNRDGNYARRVLGRVKHKGYVVLDVTFSGTTVTTTPNHLFYSASRGAWVPVGSMRPGELLRDDRGLTRPILAISPPRHGFVELYGIEVEEFHTYFVGGEAGSALVHNGMGDCFKKPAMPTEADHIKAVRTPGRYNATVGSEAEARRIVQSALPHATEVPRAVPGQPYPQAGPGVKAWYQVQPPEPGVGNNLPHVKYEDWTGGKKFKGGRWGHLFFTEPE